MSSERSGSNLVRKILGEHADLIAPPPLHAWRHFNRLLPYYGPLGNPENLKRLIVDVLKVPAIKNSHLSWKYFPTEAELSARVKKPTLSSVLGELYGTYADHHGKKGWVCKENNLFETAFKIKDTYPDAKFIYLVRDGRDVACSIKKVPSHDQEAFFIAKEWKEEQIKCLQVYNDLQGTQSAFMLHYEKLITQPEVVVRELCRFLNLDFQSTLLNFYKDKSSKKEAVKTDYWKNLSKPVMSDNFNKYKKELTEKEIKIFEHIAGDVLKLLAYQLDFPVAKLKLTRLDKGVFWLKNKLAVRKQRKTMLQETGRAERSDVIAEIVKNLKR